MLFFILLIWNPVQSFSFILHYAKAPYSTMLKLISNFQLSCIAQKQVFLDLCHCHTKRRLGWHQTSQVFFWYETDYKIICDNGCCLHGWHIHSMRQYRLFRVVFFRVPNELTYILCTSNAQNGFESHMSKNKDFTRWQLLLGADEVDALYDNWY